MHFFSKKYRWNSQTIINSNLKTNSLLCLCYEESIFYKIQQIMLKFSNKQRVLKNFLSLTISYVLLYASVNSNGSVQSIFNQHENLGTTSQMIQFLTEVFTTLVIPQLICETLGFKFSLILGQFCHLTCNISYYIWKFSSSNYH